MLRSIVAVVAGFVVTAGLVMLITSGGAALLGVAAGEPTPAYLVLNLAGGFLAGLAGGAVTARLARVWVWRHVGSLAAVLLVLATPAALQPPSPGQPGWYPLVLVVLGPVAVAAGGWLALRRQLRRGAVRPA